MTVAGRLAALFPGLQLVLIAGALVQLFLTRELVWLGAALFGVYGFPLLLFRLHEIFFPLREEVVDIAEPKYNRWWTSHQLQLLYIAVPALEGAIHLFPGLYSLWLRLWGSKIGRGVYWTPKVEVIDRSLLIVGDRVVVGHLAAFCSHAVTPINGKMSLIIRRVRVGAGAFVGAETRLGPGAELEAGKMLRARTILYWKGVFKE